MLRNIFSRIVHLTRTDTFSEYNLAVLGRCSENWSRVYIKRAFPIHNVEKKRVISATDIGNTDTRHYTKLSSNIYRFSPNYMYPSDIRRIHGQNERISQEGYQEAVNFFYHLLSNAEKMRLDSMHGHHDLWHCMCSYWQLCEERENSGPTFQIFRSHSTVTATLI